MPENTPTGIPSRPAVGDPHATVPPDVAVRTAPVTETGPQNPFPYVVAFVIGILAIWGLMTYQQREDQPVPIQAHAPEPFVSLSPDVEQVTTVAVDPIEQPTRIVVATPEQPVQTVVVERPEVPAQTVVVETTQVATAPPAVARGEAPAAVAPAPKTIEVVDLDYSAQLFPPLNEPELDAALTQLDADIDATEEAAEAKAQSAGLEILEERFEALEDRRQAIKGALSQTDRTTLTRQIEELRAELTAFQKDLASL